MSEAKSEKQSIGTYKESSLHNMLKFRYAGERGKHEVEINSYVCDAVRESGEIVEIQTGSFAPLKQKVLSLSIYNTVRIVHPIIKTKTIELYDTENHLIRTRKSPRKGTFWDLFKVLLYTPELALGKNVIIELVPVDICEVRKDDAKGSWRRKGVSVIDRFISKSYEPLKLEKRTDYEVFIPFKNDETFTSRTLAAKAGISPALAGKTLYTLTKIELVSRVEKQGNAWVYRKAKIKNLAAE